MPPSETVSARRMLELSQLSPKALQREGMGEDVDMDKFALYLSSAVRVNLVDRIVDATLSRSIDASTELAVTVNDYDRAMLTSGLLSNKLDVELDGLWFRLMGVDKQGDNVILKFEDREIAVLRTYAKWKKGRRSKITRAEFVLNLIREVKEFTIPVVIPELHTIQPISQFDGDNLGMDEVYNKSKGINVKQIDPSTLLPNPMRPKGQIPYLTVQKEKATQEQIDNSKVICAVGEDFRKREDVRRKVIVCGIMCAIQESWLKNLRYGHSTSIGLFQMLDDKGTVDQRADPEFASRWYYRTAIPIDKASPNLSYNDLCYEVERCAKENKNKYGQWRQEAEKFVNAYGITGGDADGKQTDANGSKMPTGNSGEFYFWRGDIYDRANRKYRKPENTWKCIKRLAREVEWRAFFVSGTFYFLSEDTMLAQQPAMILTEFMDGILGVDGTYNNDAKTATLTVSARVGRWSVPPGAVVVVRDMGPWNGRWIVSEYERSLFDLTANITLTKAHPGLPEPLPGAQEISPADISDWPNDQPGTPPEAQVPIEGNSISAAKSLLTMHKLGKWVDENGLGLAQIQKVAAGQKLHNRCGTDVYLDPRPIQIVLYLINLGYKVGTYAWCSDHRCNKGGHPKGLSVDIESLNGNHINSEASGEDVIAVDKLLNSDKLPLVIKPSKLISGGYGNRSDMTCRSLTIPNVEYYGESTMADHCNHIHVGYDGASEATKTS